LQRSYGKDQDNGRNKGFNHIYFVDVRRDERDKEEQVNVALAYARARVCARVCVCVCVCVYARVCPVVIVLS